MRCLKTTLIAVALLVTPALAQEALPERETGHQRAARLYRAAQWPAAAGPLTGVDVHAVKAPGLERLSLEIEPLQARATARFAQQVERETQAAARAPAALMRVRVFANPADARRDLIGSLAATQATLERLNDMPGVAFGGRASDRLRLVTGVLGNVRYELRALCDVDLQPLAIGLAQILAAAPLAREGWLPSPRVDRFEALAPQAEKPGKLILTFDPASPPPVEVAFRCSPGAAVLRTQRGYELHAAQPGEVTVEVVAVSKSLQIGRSVHTVEVAPR